MKRVRRLIRRLNYFEDAPEAEVHEVATAVLSVCASRQYSSQEVISALGRAGFAQVSQHGSHLKLRGLHGGRYVPSSSSTPQRESQMEHSPLSFVRQAFVRQGMTRAEFEQLV